VHIVVSDNGVGIAPETLVRVFEHGFTTKKDGHGFGLHGAALTAQELGGTLSAASEGPGRGATFTLDLPLGAARVDEPSRPRGRLKSVG
jgi:signal transduction histidine kinase